MRVILSCVVIVSMTHSEIGVASVVGLECAVGHVILTRFNKIAT